MILATSYPFLEVFWTMLIFFAFVVWIWILFTVIADLFRRHDTSGFAKVLWMIFIIILPFLGVFVYLIARGGKMHERAAEQAAQQQKAFDQYVQKAAGSGTSTGDELTKLADLRDRGVITADEFDREKAKILAA